MSQAHGRGSQAPGHGSWRAHGFEPSGAQCHWTIVRGLGALGPAFQILDLVLANVHTPPHEHPHVSPGISKATHMTYGLFAHTRNHIQCNVSASPQWFKRKQSGLPPGPGTTEHALLRYVVVGVIQYCMQSAIHSIPTSVSQHI